MNLIEKESIFEQYCPKCSKKISEKSEACPHCGFTLVESEVDSAISNNSETDNVANTMRALGVIIIFCGFVAGFILGRDRYDDFILSAAILWWIGGFVSGMVIFTLGEIVWRLHEISLKLDRK